MSFLQTELLTKHSWFTDFHWKPTPSVKVKNESVTYYNIILYTVFKPLFCQHSIAAEHFKETGWHHERNCSANDAFQSYTFNTETSMWIQANTMLLKAVQVLWWHIDNWISLLGIFSAFSSDIEKEKKKREHAYLWPRPYTSCTYV